MLHIDKADHFSLKWDVGEREESQMGQSQRVPGKNNRRQPVQENNKSLFISLLIRTDFPNLQSEMDGVQLHSLRHVLQACDGVAPLSHRRQETGPRDLLDRVKITLVVKKNVFWFHWCDLSCCVRGQFQK